VRRFQLNREAALAFFLMLWIVTLPAQGMALASGPAGKTVVASDLAFLGVCVTLAAGGWQRMRRPRAVTAVVFAAPVFLTAIAVLAHPGPEASLPVLRAGYSLAVLAVASHLRFSERDLVRISVAWTCSALVACAIALSAWLGVVWLGLPAGELARPDSGALPGVVRLSGLMPANSLSLYITVSSAFATFLASSGGRLERRLGAASLALMLAVAPLTASRGLMGLSVAVALMLRSGACPEPWRRARSLAALVAVVVLVSGILATRLAVFPLTLERRASLVPRVSINARPSVYSVLHTAALRLVRAEPLLGVGPGNFRRRFADVVTVAEWGATWPPFWMPRSGPDPHSAWLGSAAEGGLLTSGAWAVLFAVLARRLLSGPRARLASLLGAALVGLVINGLHMDLFPLKFVWAAFGLGVAAADTDAAGRGPRGHASGLAG